MAIPRAYYGVQYARELGAVLSQRRIYDPDYALAQDPEFYDKLRRYPPVDTNVNLRKIMVAGSDWFLEPASPALGDRAAVPIFEALLKQLRNFTVARFNLSEAIIRGATWAEIRGEWRVLEIPPLPALRWWVATHLVDMDKRRFCLVRDADLEPGQARWHVEHPLPPYETTPIERDHYVRCAYGTDEASLGYGRGLTESLLYPVWFATGLDEHGAQFGEKWAQGFRIWKLGQQGAPLTSDKRQEYLNIVDTCSTRHGMVVDKEDEFELVDAPAQGLEYITKRQEYYNAQIRTRILGSSLMTDPQVSGGSFALGDVQYQNTTALMVHFDRGVLDEAITHDLLGMLWRANYQVLRAIGLHTTGPAFYHTRDLKQHDAARRALVLQAAAGLNMPIRMDEAYEQLSLTPPVPGEPTLALPAGPSPTATPLARAAASRTSTAPPRRSGEAHGTFEMAADAPQVTGELEHGGVPAVHLHLDKGMRLEIPEPRVVFDAEGAAGAVAAAIDRAAKTVAGTFAASVLNGAKALAQGFTRLAEALQKQRPPTVHVEPPRVAVQVEAPPVDAEALAAAFASAKTTSKSVSVAERDAAGRPTRFRVEETR